MLGKFFRVFLGISILSPKNINLNFFWVSDYTDYTVYIWLYCGLWHVDADYFFCVYSSYSKEYVFTLYLLFEWSIVIWDWTYSCNSARESSSENTLISVGCDPHDAVAFVFYQLMGKSHYSRGYVGLNDPE